MKLKHNTTSGRGDLLVAALFGLLLALGCLLWFASPAHAQALPDLPPPSALAPAPADLAIAAAPAVSTPALPFTVPGWVVTALSIFGTVSMAYQALIAFAHKRAAETADPADDAWIASLETKAWFRVLDRIFYWGGYLGAKLGGKKL